MAIVREKIDSGIHARLRQQSRILNPDPMPNSQTIIWNQGNILFELLTITGDSQGKYYNQSSWHIASLAYVSERIEELENAFKAMQQQAKNVGMDLPEVMPQEMQEKMDNLLAHEDILLEEKEFLEKKLKEYADLKEVEDESKILEYGLKMSSKFHGTRAAPELQNVLASMDSQRIVQDANGLLIIDNGPYKGMSVLDYRKLAQKWINDRNAADKEKLLILKEEARLSGKPVPILLPSGSRKVDPRNLPAWPEGVINHYSKRVT